MLGWFKKKFSKAEQQSPEQEEKPVAGGAEIVPEPIVEEEVVVSTLAREEGVAGDEISAAEEALSEETSPLANKDGGDRSTSFGISFSRECCLFSSYYVELLRP